MPSPVSKLELPPDHLNFLPPDREPDFIYPPPDDTLPASYEPRLQMRLWKPTLETPGLLTIRECAGVPHAVRHKGYDYYKDVKQLQGLGALGVTPLMEAAGVGIRIEQDPAQRVTTTSMTLPGTNRLVTNVDRAADAGLVFLRLTAAATGDVRAEDINGSIARTGRMPIANPTIKTIDDRGHDGWWYYWHDLHTHIPAYLAAAQSVVHHLVRRAQRNERRIINPRAFMVDLAHCLDTSHNVGTLISLAHNQPDGDIRRLDPRPHWPGLTPDRNSHRYWPQRTLKAMRARMAEIQSWTTPETETPDLT